jgi:hypothetical protein
VNDILASLAFGAGLVLLGIWLIGWHRRAWSTQRTDETIDDREKRHYQRQFRRRMQVAALLVLLGILLPIGDWLTGQAINKQRNGRTVIVFWIVTLFLALWIMLLAAFDWLSTRMHVRATRAALGNLARKQRELEVEVARLRSKGSNGRH